MGLTWSKLVFWLICFYMNICSCERHLAGLGLGAAAHSCPHIALGHDALGACGSDLVQIGPTIQLECLIRLHNVQPKEAPAYTMCSQRGTLLGWGLAPLPMAASTSPLVTIPRGPVGVTWSGNRPESRSSLCTAGPILSCQR